MAQFQELTDDQWKLIQELTDDQWKLIQELMLWSPPKERGKPRTHLKRVWNAIFYILTRGCHWEDLPRDSRYAHRATQIIKI